MWGLKVVEYSYSDVIIDPTSKNAESLISKEVYASFIPARCLAIANGDREDRYRYFLESINPESSFPFYVRIVEADNPEDVSYKSEICIIPRKE